MPLPPHALRPVGGNSRVGQVPGKDSIGVLILGGKGQRSETENANSEVHIVASWWNLQLAFGRAFGFLCDRRAARILKTLDRESSVVGVRPLDRPRQSFVDETGT